MGLWEKGAIKPKIARAFKFDEAPATHHFIQDRKNIGQGAARLSRRIAFGWTGPVDCGEILAPCDFRMDLEGSRRHNSRSGIGMFLHRNRENYFPEQGELSAEQGVFTILPQSIPRAVAPMPVSHGLVAEAHARGLGRTSSHRRHGHEISGVRTAYL